MSPQKRPKNRSPLRAYAHYSGIAIQMLVIIALGSYGGVKLDEAYPNEYNAYTLICSLGSIALAMYVVIKQVSKNKSSLND
jgi:hypothetical protein